MIPKADIKSIAARSAKSRVSSSTVDYAERKESPAELSKRVNQKSL
jgi:hypothetical protein